MYRETIKHYLSPNDFNSFFFRRGKRLLSLHSELSDENRQATKLNILVSLVIKSHKYNLFLNFNQLGTNVIAVLCSGQKSYLSSKYYFGGLFRYVSYMSENITVLYYVCPNQSSLSNKTELNFQNTCLDTFNTKFAALYRLYMFTFFFINIYIIYIYLFIFSITLIFCFFFIS